jgi:tRNA1(Val) A37 N6-methylase TrmN6
MVAHRAALRWDRRYGVDTAGSIQLASLSIKGPNREFGNECVCTSPQSFDFMMRSLPRSVAGHTFVDIGAGKSRTLLLASRYDFASIVGVEFASELVECSRRNIARFKADWQRCRALDVVERDATQYVFPETPLVLFFYNPFTKPVFDVVLGNIVASLAAKPRDCTIVYGSSSHDAIEWAKPAILDTGRFEQIPTQAMPLFLDAVRTVRFAVFRAITPA